MVRRYLAGYLLVAVTVGAAAAAVTATAALSVTVAIIACVVLGVVILVCPLLFVHWQTHKETIHGPWDEAIPSM
jgi:phosphatidylinositol glycan class C protein